MTCGFATDGMVTVISLGSYAQVPGDERFVQAASRTLLYTISHFPSSFQYVATYSEQLPRWLEPFKRMAKAKSAGNGLFSRILGSGTPGTPSGGDYGAQKR